MFDIKNTFKIKKNAFVFLLWFRRFLKKNDFHVETYLIYTYRFAIHFNHVHNLYGIVCILLSHKLHEPITLMSLCYSVLWHVHIHWIDKQTYYRIHLNDKIIWLSGCFVLYNMFLIWQHSNLKLATVNFQILFYTHYLITSQK